MCGIAGAVAPSPVDTDVVLHMCDRLAHRGPDAAGLWASSDGRVCLGHRRLAIVDLSPDANQPFLSADGRLALTFNGEIYNWQALRAELEEDGVRFRTRSDTEVLIEAYRRWGDACVERLSGMFAFALWDADRRRLFCARDRAGEKPFYYTVAGGSFVFASELKSLLLWPGFRREPDYTALADFFTFGFVCDPKSIWEGTLKLPPAHTLVVELDGDAPRVREPRPYWDLTFEPAKNEADWGEEIRTTLERAAAEMSIADVPVGSFLSGGVDSSSVTAALARAGRDVGTYTIGFAEDGFDERPYARQVAERYRTDHTERVVDASDVGAVFHDTILWHYDEPFNDSSYLPTYYVCREARERITVALSGDGGDEVFGGYGKYRRLAVRQSLDWALPQPARRMLVGTGALVPEASPWHDRLATYGKSADSLLIDMMTTTVPRLREVARGPLAAALAHYEPTDVVRDHLRQAPPAEVGLVNAMRYLDLKLTLGAGILTKVDRASMAVSLEVRPVYLHRDVLSLAGRIPSALLADRREAKKALKSALRPWLPDAVLYRTKMGFAMPLGRWLNGDLRHLSQAVESPNARVRELLEPSFVAERVSLHRSSGGKFPSVLHSILFLEHWLETWG